jgi:hypothetical protein
MRRDIYSMFDRIWEVDGAFLDQEVHSVFIAMEERRDAH